MEGNIWDVAAWKEGSSKDLYPKLLAFHKEAKITGMSTA